MSYGNAPTFEDMIAAPLFKLYSYDARSAPSIPNVRIPTELDEFFDEICAETANALTSLLDVTRAHLYLFNVAAHNSFQNKPFDAIVVKCVEAIDAVMRTDSRARLPDIIRSVCETVVSGIAAKTAKDSRDLDRILSQQEVDILADCWEDYCKLGSSRGGRSMSERQPYSSSRQSAQSYGSRPQPPRRDEPVRAEVRSAAAAQPAARRGTVAPTARSTQPVPTVQAEMPQPRQPLVWKPSKKQPYVPLANTSKTNAALVPDPEGDGVITVFNEIKGENMEPYSAHSTSGMGPRYTYQDQKARDQDVRQALQMVGELVKERTPIVLSEANPPVFEASEMLLGTKAMRAYLSVPAKDSKTIGASSCGGIVYAPLISDTDENQVAVFNWLADSRTFEGLGKSMEMLLQGTHPKYKLNSSVVRRLDAEMTKAFNRILHRQLSINPNDLELTSFALNIEQVMRAFATVPQLNEVQYGLKKAEFDFIQLNTMILNEGQRDVAMLNYEGVMAPEVFDGNFKAKLQFQGWPYLVVALGINADELEMQLDLNETRALVKSEHAELADLAKTLVDSINPLTETTNRVVFTTLDNYWFELDKGLLGEHYYLITRTR